MKKAIWCCSSRARSSFIFWYPQRLPLVVDRIHTRLGELSGHLGDADWLDAGFSAGELMMVSVLQTLKPSGLLDEHPKLAAYVARRLRRPASGPAATQGQALPPAACCASCFSTSSASHCISRRTRALPRTSGWCNSHRPITCPPDRRRDAQQPRLLGRGEHRQHDSADAGCGRLQHGRQRVGLHARLHVRQRLAEPLRGAGVGHASVEADPGPRLKHRLSVSLPRQQRSRGWTRLSSMPASAGSSRCKR
ncbi:MAG TPA: hypothetical protein VLI06_20685 [Solimonas sp.]|nr:hypothetical protein [Solimonas sp.]